MVLIVQSFGRSEIVPIQASQIQKVSAQIELNKPALHTGSSTINKTAMLQRCLCQPPESKCGRHLSIPMIAAALQRVLTGHVLIADFGLPIADCKELQQ